MKHFLAIASIVFLAARLASAAERPNILVIVADDLGYGDIGVHGGDLVPTPKIDALAASGVRCTIGYVSAPYCSPSRAGLLTGRYQTRFGHEFNPHNGPPATLGLPLDQRTLANYLHDAGYATALVGKWHEGFDAPHQPQSRGFDEFFGFLVGMHNFILHKDAKPTFGTAFSQNMIYRGREVQQLDGYLTDLLTDEAIGFIDRQGDKPWFLYLAYNAVHTPLEVLEKHQSRIPASVTDPQRRGYASLLLGLDDGIGKLTEHLRGAGRDKNTLIFFFSDNGGPGHKRFMAYNTAHNAPLRGDKSQTLEGGIRVPFFVSWTGRIPAGKVYDEPVIALDVFPTALARAGIPVPAECDGVDLLAHLTGENSLPPHEALYWRFGPQKAIRRGPWKLVDWREFETDKNSGWQLYDLSTDVGEEHDVAQSHPQLVSDLERSWDDWDAKNVAPRWHGDRHEDPTAPAPARR